MQTPQILIVEDEQVTRNTLKSIFEAEGDTLFLRPAMVKRCTKCCPIIQLTW